MTNTGGLIGTVHTVAGPLAPEALGPTTMHEHILTVEEFLNAATGLEVENLMQV